MGTVLEGRFGRTDWRTAAIDLTVDGVSLTGRQAWWEQRVALGAELGDIFDF
jgi:hypothetical protein